MPQTPGSTRTGTPFPYTWLFRSDACDARVDVSGELTVTQADVAGLADVTGAGERLAVADLTAADARLTTTCFLTLGDVAAAGRLDASAAGSIFIDGAVTGTAKIGRGTV